MKKFILIVLFLISLAFPKEIKVMFAGWDTFEENNENGDICEWRDHWMSIDSVSTTTLKNMYEEGWYLVSVQKIASAKQEIQFFFFLERE